MPLNKRPHSVNTYAYSKLLYRCNVIDPRVADITCFKSKSKSFVNTGLLEKPEEITLHREVEDGGRGLLHIESRSKAALIMTFLQTAINPNFKRNFFHNTLYRQYVQDEQLNAPKIPPNFSGDFFPTIRKLASSSSQIELSTIKSVYNFLILDLLNNDPAPGGDDQEERSLKPFRCEILHPDTDWKRLWRLARLKGLGSELTTFILSLLWGILPTRVRLNKILPIQYQITICALCDKSGRQTPETLLHAIMECPENQEIPALLLTELQSSTPGLTYSQVISLDLDIDQEKELPIVWLIGSLLHSIWTQRTLGRVTAVKTRADLEARCRLLREGNIPVMINAYVMTEAAIRSIFSRVVPPINAQAPGQQ